MLSTGGLNMRKSIATCLLGVALASAAESPAVLDANGILLGSYSGVTVQPRVRVISPLGYSFVVDAATGQIATTGSSFSSDTVFLAGPNYESLDCTGPASFEVASADPSGVRPGFVVRSPIDDTIWYAPHGQTLMQRALGSNRDTVGVCRTLGSGLVPSYSVLPNDPAVTGVPSSIPGPLSISQSIVPRAMLRDGFENPQAALSASRVEGVA